MEYSIPLWESDVLLDIVTKSGSTREETLWKLNKFWSSFVVYEVIYKIRS